MNNGLTREATSKLVQDVDELLAWKLAFNRKQADLIAWQSMVMDLIQAQKETLNTTLKGCNVLVECDSELRKTCDELSRRIDIANKRIRRLEEAVERLTPR